MITSFAADVDDITGSLSANSSLGVKFVRVFSPCAVFVITDSSVDTQ